MPFDPAVQVQPIARRTASYILGSTGRSFAYTGVIAWVTRLSDMAELQITSKQRPLVFNNLVFGEDDGDFDGDCAGLFLEGEA